MDIVKDIKNYLNDQSEIKINQQYIRMKYLFQGYIIKAWHRMNFGTTKYYYHNKIIIRICIEFYAECWKHRNEVLHKPELQR